MEFEILGPLRVTEAGQEVDLGSRKQRTLLALLTVGANRVVTTERIIDELWPGDPEGHENALWVYISRLRGILEPGRSGRGEHEVLQTRDHGYVLNVAGGSIDALRFELDAPGVWALGCSEIGPVGCVNIDNLAFVIGP